MENLKYCVSLISVLLLASFCTMGQSADTQYQSGAAGMKAPIQLLVRADDIGNDYGRTVGIIKAYKEGIVTSTSIMPASPFFEESVRLCKENPELAVGIHITLLGTRTRSTLSPEIVKSILTPQGFFYETLDQFNNANPKIEEIEKEIRAQIQKVRDSGLHFVYLDYHRNPPETVKKLIIKICNEQKLIYGQNGLDGTVYGYKRILIMPESWPIQKAPDGQIIRIAAPAFTDEQHQSFFEGLTELKPGKWILVVHPGVGEPQRNSVVELLCSPKTKEIIKMINIQLVSYYDLWEDEFGVQTITKNCDDQ